MSMCWDYKCSRCGREFSVMQPETYGLPIVCYDCWTDADSIRLANFHREKTEKEYEELAENKLEKIPMWIRRIFGAL